MSGNFAQEFPPVLSGPLDPSDVDDVLFDFTDRLDGTTISTLNYVHAQPASIALQYAEILPASGGANTGVGVQVSGAVVNTQYRLTAQVVTSDNRVLTRSLILPCAYR